MGPKMQDRPANVIVFPRLQRARLAARCDDGAQKVCSHCGGLLQDGESEDDCSTISGVRILRLC